MDEGMIIEGNKLIAEFLNFPINSKQIMYDTRIYYDISSLNLPSGITICCEELYDFHRSWDWIMVVVGKIENTKPFYSVSNGADFWYNDEDDTTDKNRIQYVCIISDSRCRIIINSSNYFPERNNKLFATWIAVVEFIKWYNEKANNN